MGKCTAVSLKIMPNNLITKIKHTTSDLIINSIKFTSQNGDSD